MSDREMDLTVTRIAAQILEKHPTLEDVVLVGIRRRGVPLAQALVESLQARQGRRLECGVLDITFYRDDLSLVDRQPVVHGSDLPFEVHRSKVILVDDVLHTGRTIRSGLESVLDYGRPAKVELAVLIDRGERELPIQADYVGKTMGVGEGEVIDVRLPPIDSDKGVYTTTLELLQQEHSVD